MRKRIIISTLLALCVSAGTAIGHATEPSAGCGGGTGEQAGVGVKDGVPADAMVCNNGSKVPSPGAVSVHTDSNSKSGYVDVDGDSTNTTKPCADGFERVGIDSTGPHFYESPDGSYTDTDPKKKGNQQAQSESADTWAGNLKANCTA